jgi:DNA-binding XRE family transcriptional regulator
MRDCGYKQELKLDGAVAPCSWVEVLFLVQHNRLKDGAETMEPYDGDGSDQMTSARDLRMFRAVLEAAFARPKVFSMADTRPLKKSETAQHFKSLRRKALLTQKRLGEIIKVCRQSVNEIERGHVMAHPTTWNRFCELEEKHNQPEIRMPLHWE